MSILLKSRRRKAWSWQTYFVVLACPLADGTRRMVNAASLAKMKRSAFLIKVARGPIVDHIALLDALREVRSPGQVWMCMRPILWIREAPFRLPNVIATPHCAGISELSLRAMGISAVDAILKTLRGEWPANVINPEVKGHMRGGKAPWGEGLRPY